MPDPLPTVLIRITENSRLEVMQTDGVLVGFIDLRTDEQALVILPQESRAEDIMRAIAKPLLLTMRQDDRIKTAAAVVARLKGLRVVVAEGPA